MSGSDSPSYNRGNFGGRERGRTKSDAGRFFVTAGPVMSAAHGSPQSQPEQTEKSTTNTHPVQPGRYTQGGDRGWNRSGTTTSSQVKTSHPDRSGIDRHKRHQRQFLRLSW